MSDLIKGLGFKFIAISLSVLSIIPEQLIILSKIGQFSLILKAIFLEGRVWKFYKICICNGNSICNGHRIQLQWMSKKWSLLTFFIICFENELIWQIQPYYFATWVLTDSKCDYGKFYATMFHGGETVCSNFADKIISCWYKSISPTIIIFSNLFPQYTEISSLMKHLY